MTLRHPSGRRPHNAGLLLALAVLAVLSGCDSRDADDAKGRTTTTTAAPTEDAPAGEDGPGSAPSTLAADLFEAVTTEPAPPKASLDVAITGTVDLKAAGEAVIRCVRGPGYLDVDIVADPPLHAGDRSVASMTFGAPGFRGPGRYDARKADDAEWSVGLVDVATGETFEFYSPLDGVDGRVTIDEDGRSGSFDVDGLVDDERAPVSVSGSFACSVVEEGR